MNIFYLDSDPQKCAEYHCDKHVVKMIVEYAQLLSTAHRVLDGDEYVDYTTSNRKIKRYRLKGDVEDVIYKASHVNHPSNIWTRTSSSNYKWLFKLWYELCLEYKRRYHKEHATYIKLNQLLQYYPKNIEIGELTPIALAMPDDVKDKCPIKSYRKFYNVYKKDFAIWKNAPIPSWFVPAS